jgi:hypothetical protein
LSVEVVSDFVWAILVRTDRAMEDEEDVAAGGNEIPDPRRSQQPSLDAI